MPRAASAVRRALGSALGSALGRRLRVLFDAALYRRPFEGLGAERYVRDARPAFGDFDERLLSLIAERYAELVTAPGARLLEVGAGPAAFAHAAALRFPQLSVIAIEPGRELAHRARATTRTTPRLAVVRAVAEALPLAAASISLAVCLSSIRHVADRSRSFAELRRALVPGGALIIVELDPEASARRIAYHADRLEGRFLRAAFGPLIVRTAPPWQRVVERAAQAGFTLVRKADDATQPFYLLELR